jgi:hypothetical protein
MITLALIVVPCALGTIVLVIELVDNKIPVIDSERNIVLRKIPRQRSSHD